MRNTSAKRPIRLIVDISDLHCGSSVGLCPPGFQTLEGQTVGLNAAQRWLWECWQSVNERLAKYIGDDPFALVINGDVIEGQHHRSVQVISSDTADHLNAAIAVLENLSSRAAKTYIVDGTEVHSGSTEATLAKVLKAEPDPDTGKASWERLTLTICGIRCVFQHHISATVREYLKGSMLSIFLGNEQLAAAKNGEPIPQVLGCAHRHDYDKFEDATGLCFVSPCWQVKTRHGQKVVPAARVKPGLIVLDWRNKPDGALPHVEPIICRAPAAKGAVI